MLQGDTDASSSPKGRRAILWIAALLLMPWLVYLPAIGGPFLFDDLTGVLEITAAHAHDPGRILRFWEEGRISERPVRYLSYACDWWLGRGSPLPFHLTNILLHCLNGLAIGWLASRLSRRPLLAVLVAAIFLLHPLQTSAVAYISGRKDLLCTLFALLALHAHIGASRSDPGGRRLLLSAAFFVAGFLAVFSKEMAVSLPLAALVLDRALQDADAPGRTAAGPAPEERIRGGSLRSAIGRRPIFYGLFLVVGLPAMAYKLLALPGTRLSFGSWSDQLSNLPLALQTLALWVRKFVWPWPHLADMREHFPRRALELVDDPAPALTWGEFWNGGGLPATAVGLLLLAGLIVAIRHTRAPDRWLARSGFALFLVTILPVANLVRLNEPAAEHYVYLPMTGLALLLGVWLVPLLEAERGRRRWRPLAALCLLVMMAGFSSLRAADWGSEERLWRSVLRVNRSSSRAHNNLGLFELDRGGDIAARQHFERALALSPRSPRVAANLMALFQKEGDLAGAISLGGSSLQANPDNRLLLSLQASLLLDGGIPAQAKRLLDKIAVLPDDGDAPLPKWRRDLAAARSLAGDARGAVALLELLTVEEPDDPTLWTNLGAALLQLDRLQEAELALQRALALPNPTGNSYRNMAVVLLKTGRPLQAKQHLDAAIARGIDVPPSLVQAISDSLAAREE